MKKTLSAVLGMALLLLLALPSSGAESAPTDRAADDTFTTHNCWERGDANRAGISGVQILEALGCTSAEIDAVPASIKWDLANSAKVVGSTAYYAIASDGTPFSVTEESAQLGAQAIKSGQPALIPLTDSQFTRVSADGYFKVTTYTASSSGRRTQTSVIVTWLTEPSIRKTDVVGITLNGNSMLHNTLSASLSYKKTSYTPYYGATTTNETVSYTAEKSNSVASGAAYNGYFSIDLPSDLYSISGVWEKYEDFIIVMSCYGTHAPGTSGLAAHCSVGYYAHSTKSLEIDSSLEMSAGFTGKEPSASGSIKIVAKFVDSVVEVICPAYLEAEYE